MVDDKINALSGARARDAHTSCVCTAVRWSRTSGGVFVGGNGIDHDLKSRVSIHQSEEEKALSGKAPVQIE